MLMSATMWQDPVLRNSFANERHHVAVSYFMW